MHLKIISTGIIVLSLTLLLFQVSGSIQKPKKPTILLNANGAKLKEGFEDTSPVKRCSCCCYSKVTSNYIERRCARLFKCANTEIVALCSACRHLEHIASSKSKHNMRGTTDISTKITIKSTKPMGSKIVPQYTSVPSNYVKFSSQFDPQTNQSRSGFIPLAGVNRRSSHFTEWSKRSSLRKHTNSHSGRPITTKKSSTKAQTTEKQKISRTKSTENHTSMRSIDPARKKASKSAPQRTVKTSTKESTKSAMVGLPVKPESSKTFISSIDEEDYFEAEDVSLERVITEAMPTERKFSSIDSSEWLPMIRSQHFPDQSLEGITFSSPYDPKRNTSSSGFVPISGPYGSKRKPFRRQPYISNRFETARTANSRSSDILGDGNFEIITGGIFSDYEDNEIDRFSAVRYSQSRGRRKKFNAARDFYFPSYFTEDLPAQHPLMLPRKF